MNQTLFNISLDELCQIEHIETNLVLELVEFGIADPILHGESEEWYFDTSSVHWMKKAIRLYRDLEIDWIAVALVIELMQEKEALQKQNQIIERQLRRFIES